VTDDEAQSSPAPSPSPGATPVGVPGALDTWVGPTDVGPYDAPAWPPPPSASDDASGGTGGVEVHRRRRWWIVVAVVVVVVAGLVVGLVVAGGGSSTESSSTAGGAAAARRLLAQSVAAAVRANTFHYVSTSTSAGVTQTTVGDAAPDQGSQVITIGAHTFDILVIGTTAYFKGDAVTMQSQLDLDPVVAQQHAGQWISLQPSDSPYQSVYEAVTTQSALADSITISPTAVLPSTTIGQVAVTPIRGALTPVAQMPTKGTARLDIASSSHLPVQFTGSGSVDNQQAVESVVFSQWGESVSIAAPAGALAYSSIQIGGITPTPGGTVLT